MGGFYGSVQVRTEERPAVLAAVKALAGAGERFLVGPLLDGWVGIYPSGNGQSVALAPELAKRLLLPLIHVLVHDDDIFAYEAYARGEPLDSYSSRPDYFAAVNDAERERLRGRPELLALFAPHAAAQAIAEVLEAGRRDQQEPAYLLLGRFAALLAIRNAVTSFEYLERDEREGIVGWRQFTRVPDNRAALRAAAQALKKAWEALRQRGVLLVHDEQLRVNAVCAAADGSLLALRGGIPVQAGCVERWSAPWAQAEPLLGVQLATARNLAMDPTGRWLATGHAFGESVARIWDLRSRSLAFEVQHKQMVDWTCFTADAGLVVTLGPELVVTDVATGTRVGQRAHGLGGRTAVIDDSRGLLAVATSDQKGLAVFQLPQAVPLERPGTHHRHDAESAFAMCLDAPGDRLIVATEQGLRVYSWSAAIAQGRTWLEPIYAVSMRFVYAAVLDAARGRVLYGGLEGSLATLDLATGAARTLLVLPGESSIYQLALSAGGTELAINAGSRPTSDRKQWSGLLIIDLQTLG